MTADPTPNAESAAAAHGRHASRAPAGSGRGLEQPPARLPTTVVLRHDLPDGSWHLDWMLQPGGAACSHPDDRVLVTFRLQARPDQLACGANLPAQRLSPHRAIYLRFEGDIGGGRGSVTRMAAGEVLTCRVDEAAGRIVVRWDGAADRAVAGYRLDRLEGDRWQVIATEECGHR